MTSPQPLAPDSALRGERPALLFLSQCLPYPPDGGVKIRTYHVLRLLSAAFDVTALCFYRAKGAAREHNVETAVAALSTLARMEAFPIPQEHSRGRLLLDHLRSVVERRVYTRYAYASRRYRERLLSLLRDSRFDLVHADSLDLAAYFPLVGDLPLVCVHHDAQSILLRRRAQYSTGLARAYVRYQAKRMAVEERTWCGRVTLNVTVSEQDQRALAALAPGGRFATVPNGVDTDYFVPEKRENSGLVFVGGTAWFPNKDALQYYQAAILPALRAQGITDRTTWVGQASDDEIDAARRTDDLTLTGYVKDIRPYVHEAACYVVPLRIGGGTRLKILDAWAMGKAVVSTSIGCEGLDAVDGQNILIRDEPEPFAQAVRRVIREPELRRQLGRAARNTVERRYSWTAIGQDMVKLYRSLLAGS